MELACPGGRLLIRFFYLFLCGHLENKFSNMLVSSVPFFDFGLDALHIRLFFVEFLKLSVC